MTTTTMVLTAAVFTLGGTDVSEQTTDVEVTAEVDVKDVTTYASAGWKEVRGGLKSGGVKGKFLNTYVDNALDEFMWANYLAGTPIAFTVKADSAATSASNPVYSGKTLVKGWRPVGGKPGDVAEVDFDYPTSGAITRGTT